MWILEAAVNISGYQDSKLTPTSTISNYGQICEPWGVCFFVCLFRAWWYYERGGCQTFLVSVFPNHLAPLPHSLSCISVFLYLGNPYSCIHLFVNTPTTCFVVRMDEFIAPQRIFIWAEFVLSCIWPQLSSTKNKILQLPPPPLPWVSRIMSMSGWENCFQKMKSQYENCRERPDLGQRTMFRGCWSEILILVAIPNKRTTLLAKCTKSYIWNEDIHLWWLAGGW